MIGGPAGRLRSRVRWLWHTWPFQFAHGPLCARFREDVLRLGRVHLCRSCVALYSGAAIALAALLAFPPGGDGLLALGGVLGVVVAVLSWPPRYKRMPRRVRDLVRAGAGVWVAAVVALWFSGLWLAAAIGTAAIVGMFVLFSRVRMRQRVHACVAARSSSSRACARATVAKRCASVRSRMRRPNVSRRRSPRGSRPPADSVGGGRRDRRAPASPHDAR